MNPYGKSEQMPPIHQAQVEIDENGRLKVRETGKFGITVSTVRSIVEMPDGDIYFL